MDYHGPTGQFTVSKEQLEMATHNFYYALARVRRANDLPLTPYEKKTGLTDADHTMKAIVDAADQLGIKLGGNWGHEIDVSKYKN